MTTAQKLATREREEIVEGGKAIWDESEGVVVYA